MEQAGMIIGILGGILGAVGVVCSIILGVVAWKRTKRHDVQQECATDAGMRLDMDYIKRGVDTIQVDLAKMRDTMGELSVRVARCEESCKSAHHRIDGMER